MALKPLYRIYVIKNLDGFLVAWALEVKINHNAVVLCNLTEDTHSPFLLKHTTSVCVCVCIIYCQ